VAPVPYLASSVVATTVLVRADAGDLLGKLGSGERIAVLAVPLAAAGVAAATVEATDGRLSGAIAGVGDGLVADLLLVPTAGGLYAVDATAAGVTRTPVVSLDLTRPLADVVLSDAPGQLLVSGSAAAEAVRAGLIAGAALLASEQLGLAEWCLQTTVEYVKTRHQFGRPIGGFQAIKHRLADVWVELAQARAVARYAAVCAATDDPDLPVAASLAQAYCSPMAVKAAEECVQLHGGIGFTWEHPAHLYLKRAKASALAYGTADHHRQLLAGLVDLPA
jgi:alkylation response protein AidB-like acyl-CoA dehydrogenase